MYFVKGADQKEYGPVSTEQLRQWIAENRLNQFSVARKDGETVWKPLGQFEELASLFGLGSVPPPAPAAPSAYPAFPTVQPVPPGSHSSATSRSNNHLGPAIGMIVVGALSLLMSVVQIVVLAVQGTKQMMDMMSKFGGAGQIPPEMMGVVQGAAYAVYGLQLLLAVLVILGGVSFLRLKSRGLAMASAVVMVIPCCGTASFLCALGIPLGIWALVVLSQAETKEAFDNH